jgi:hypothetical protein
MTISSDARQLANLKYSQQAQEISSGHWKTIKHYESNMPRGGGMRSAIDKEHFDMAQELSDLYITLHLEAFANEDLIPDEQDLQEMERQVAEIVRGCGANELYTPLVSTNGEFQTLLMKINGRLRTKVGQMRLESRLQKPAAVAQPASHQINIYGHNLGPIQQGGQNNTQNVLNAQFNAKIQELLNLIDIAQELSPVQKLKANTDIKAIQELSKLETTPEVQEEARSRLDGIISVISMSADMVSLGMPIIQIIQAFFGV